MKNQVIITRLELIIICLFYSSYQFRSGPHLTKISEQFNRISFGVSTEILTIINLEQRQEKLKWAVETMQVWINK